MSSSTPLLTCPREDTRTSIPQVKDTVTPGKEQSALPWNPQKRCQPKRAGEGGKQLPKPGVRNSRCELPPPSNQAKSVLETTATHLGTSAFGTSTMLDASTTGVKKSSSRMGTSSGGEGTFTTGMETFSAVVEKSYPPPSSEGQGVIVSPPQDIPPPTLELVKSSTPVHIPDIPVSNAAIPTAEVIINKPQKKVSLTDVSKVKRTSVVEKIVRKSSSVEAPRSKRTSVSDVQRSKRKSVTESSRKTSVTDGPKKASSVDNTRAGITPETQRAAEVWKSRTSALKYRGGAKPLHVSFGEMAMDHSGDQKGMSEHKRRHNLHPLARFRSLAITTNNRARRSRRSRNSVYSIDPSLLERPGRIREINSMEEFKERLDQAKEALVCVTFSAKWCGPWRMIKPDVHRLSHIHGDVEFYEIDVDDNEEIAEARRVACMPTFQFFKRGIMLDKFAEPNRIKLDETIRKLRKMEIRPEE